MKVDARVKIKCDISYIIKNVFYNAGFKYRDKIYWDKQNLKNLTAWGSYESSSDPNILLPFEEIVILYKQTKKKQKMGTNVNEMIDKEFKEYVNGHWVINGEVRGREMDNCPAPFPQEIPSRLIKLFSYRGDIVLDPFSGNGTTCVVAKKLGRNYIGFELSKKYTDYANRRIGLL